MSPRPRRAESWGRFELLVDTLPLPLVPGPDDLITLAEAAELPRLGGLFNKRKLYAAAKREASPLQTTKMSAEIMTTPAWIDQWIEDGKSWHAPAKPLDSGSTRNAILPSTTFSTTTVESASKSARTAAREASAKLRASSPRTSRRVTPKQPPTPQP